MSVDLEPVLAHYPADCRAEGVEFLASAGGFSGAAFWRLQSPRGELCLRRWPAEHPSAERLRFIHGVLGRAVQQGFHLAAVPLPTGDAGTFVRHHGHLWELAPWMPGRADYHDRPSPARLHAAMVALAGFHVATATFPHGQPPEAPSPGIRSRRERLTHLMSGGLAELARDVQQHHQLWPELAERTCRLFDLFPRVSGDVMTSLTAAEDVVVAQQPCIRDVWHDHIFFQGDRVTGIIDFGAMRLDNVATDVARLLGSLAHDDEARWRDGLSAYESAGPLSPIERRLARTFDQSSALLAGFNWVQWVFRDLRQFEDRPVILARVDAMLDRWRT